MPAYAVNLNVGACGRRFRWLGQVQRDVVVVIAAGHDVRISIPIEVTHAYFEIGRNTKTRNQGETLAE